MAERKDTNGLLKEIRDEIQKQSQGEGTEELQDKLKESGQAMVQAIASGDALAQQELTAMRVALKSQLAVQMAFEKAAEMRSEQLQATVEEVATEVEKANDPADQAEIQRKSLFLGLRDFLGNDFKEKFTGGLAKIAEGIKNTGGAAFEKVTDTGKSILEFVTTLAKMAAGAIALMGFLDGWENATEWFGKNADIGDKISSALATILGSFLGLDVAMQKDLAIKLAAVMDQVEKFFTSLWTNAKLLFKGIFEGDKSKVVTGIKGIGTTLIDAFAGVVKTILTTLGFGPESAIYKAITSVQEKITGIFSGIVTTLTGIFTGDANAVTTGINEVFTNFVGVFKTAANFILTVFGVGEKSKVRKFINDIFSSVTGIFSGIVTTLTGLFTGDGNAVTTGIKDMYTNIFGIFKSAANFILDIFGVGEKSKVRKMVNDLFDTITGLYTGMVTTIGNIFGIGEDSKLTAKIKEVWTSLTGAFAQAKDWITDQFTFKRAVDPETGEEMSIMGSLWENLKTSLQSAFQSIFDKVGAFFNDLWTGVVAYAQKEMPDWLVDEIFGEGASEEAANKAETDRLVKLAEEQAAAAKLEAQQKEKERLAAAEAKAKADRDAALAKLGNSPLGQALSVQQTNNKTSVIGPSLTPAAGVCKIDDAESWR